MNGLPADTRQWPHGTETGYSKHRCRCEACRSWMRQKERDRRHRRGDRSKAQQLADVKNAALAAKAAFRADPADVRHGTVAGYAYDCRCDRCREANRLAHLTSVRAARQRGAVPEHVHGTVNGYGYWGCRCDRCRAANTDQSRRRREGRSA